MTTDKKTKPTKQIPADQERHAASERLTDAAAFLGRLRAADFRGRSFALLVPQRIAGRERGGTQISL